MKRRVLAVILSIACLTSIFTGCSLKKSNESKKKTVVTLVYNQKLNNFEKYVESKLPDVDLQWEHMASSPLSTTIKRRLKAGHGPDLVVSTQPADEESSADVLPLTDMNSVTVMRALC